MSGKALHVRFSCSVILLQGLPSHTTTHTYSFWILCTPCIGTDFQKFIKSQQIVLRGKCLRVLFTQYRLSSKYEGVIENVNFVPKFWKTYGFPCFLIMQWEYYIWQYTPYLNFSYLYLLYAWCILEQRLRKYHYESSLIVMFNFVPYKEFQVISAMAVTHFHIVRGFQTKRTKQVILIMFDAFLGVFRKVINREWCSKKACN